MPPGQFFGYMVLLGALSGLIAWLMVLVGHLAFGITRPTLGALLFAIPRGSLFAVLLGLVLRWHWSRKR